MFRLCKKHTETERFNGYNFSFGDGDISYWLGYLLHRDNDQPAIIASGGIKKWYQHGKRHRDNDRPAIICCSSKKWYRRDKLHRDNDRPAIIYSEDWQEWYQYGKQYCPK